jgi:hypothetical protein
MAQRDQLRAQLKAARAGNQEQGHQASPAIEPEMGSTRSASNEGGNVVSVDHHHDVHLSAQCDQQVREALLPQLEALQVGASAVR